HAVAKRERGYVMSKSEAQGLADKLRADIREGRHVAPGAPEATATPATLTFSDIARQYLKRHINVPPRRRAAAQSISNYVGMLERLPVLVGEGQTAPLGTRAFTSITKADLEAVREARRAELAVSADARVRAGCKAGEVGIEHLMATARQIWN